MSVNDFFRKHKIEIIIFALALAARLALFAVNFHAAHGDFTAAIEGNDGYYAVSKNLIDGNGYSMGPGPAFLVEPLRPPIWIFIMAFLAKIFGSFVPVFIFEVIIGSLIPVMAMRLASRIIPPKLSVAVGLLFALEPTSVLLSFVAITEIPFTFFFLLFLLFLFRYLENTTTRNIVWSGVFLGLSILIKPTVQFFPILIPAALYLINRKRKTFSADFYKHCAYFVLVSILIIVPWFYRNYRVFGVFGMSAQPAYNLYEALVPTVLSIDHGTAYLSEFKIIASTLVSRGDNITLANSDKYVKESLEVLSKHKLAFAKSIGISVVTFFTHDGMLTVLNYAGITVPNVLSKPALVLLATNPKELARDILFYFDSPALLVFVGRLFWIMMSMLFFAGAWLYIQREKFSPFAWLGLCIVAYFSLLTTVNGFGMNARFRIPVLVFIFTFAVYAFSVLWRRTMTKFLSKRR